MVCEVLNPGLAFGGADNLEHVHAVRLDAIVQSGEILKECLTQQFQGWAAIGRNFLALELGNQPTHSLMHHRNGIQSGGNQGRLGLMQKLGIISFGQGFKLAH